MVGSRDTPIKIYRIVCISNGKVYVGVTKGSLAKRWAKHVYEAKKRDYLFGRAILKYGNRAFLIEHIASAATADDALATETRMITQENSRSPIGYNSNDGGIGSLNPSIEVRNRLRAHRHSPETIRRMREVQSARSEEWRANLSRALTGHIKSAETRRKLGAYVRTEVQRQKIAAALIGRTFSDERRAVQSAAIKAWWAARKATKAGVLL